jgi:hypothetical protein
MVSIQGLAMVNERALNHALLRLRGFRSHVFGTITQAMVDEYHSIVVELAVASERDLYIFKIPPSKKAAPITFEVKKYQSLHISEVQRGSTPSNLYDKVFFKEQIDRLLNSFLKTPQTEDDGGPQGS